LIGFSAIGTGVIVQIAGNDPAIERPDLAIDPAASGEGGECPAREGQGSYDPQLTPESGPPGTIVTASGLTPQTHERGGPPDLITLWWNLDYEQWPSVLPEVEGPPVGERFDQPVRALGEFDDAASRCTWEIQFKVPDVQPGDWQVTALQHGRDRNEAAMFTPVIFRVTP
jgi:hypothetical protein